MHSELLGRMSIHTQEVHAKNWAERVGHWVTSDWGAPTEFVTGARDCPCLKVRRGGSGQRVQPSAGGR